MCILIGFGIHSLRIKEHQLSRSLQVRSKKPRNNQLLPVSKLSFSQMQRELGLLFRNKTIEPRLRVQVHIHQIILSIFYHLLYALFQVEGFSLTRGLVGAKVWLLLEEIHPDNSQRLDMAVRCLGSVPSFLFYSFIDLPRQLLEDYQAWEGEGVWGVKFRGFSKNTYNPNDMNIHIEEEHVIPFISSSS